MYVVNSGLVLSENIVPEWSSAVMSSLVWLLLIGPLTLGEYGGWSPLSLRVIR